MKIQLSKLQSQSGFTMDFRNDAIATFEVTMILDYNTIEKINGKRLTKDDLIELISKDKHQENECQYEEKCKYEKKDITKQV